LLADEGILVDRTLPDIESFVEAPLIALGTPRPPLDRAILKQTGEAYAINYYPIPRSKRTLLRVLGPYDEALEDLFGTGAKTIADVLQSASTLILRSIPVPDEPEEALAFDATLGDGDFANSFSFMLSLCRKGFVRLPEQHLRERLTQVMIKAGSTSLEEATACINSFFQAFCLREPGVGRLDVVRLEPLPILYTSPSRHCYLDLVWMDDFLRWLVVRSKEWFSSQHGDRFTLTLKRMLNERALGAQVLSQKNAYVAPSGARCEVDLLVEKAGVLYAIECKAYAKSRAFWLGEPQAISQRTQKLADAVQQAKKAAAIVQEAANAGLYDLPRLYRVEWVVCLPSQEFLNPVDKYGYLSYPTPRVCTPEELASHLA
jgi:hypothetical protein